MCVMYIWCCVVVKNNNVKLFSSLASFFNVLLLCVTDCSLLTPDMDALDCLQNTTGFPLGFCTDSAGKRLGIWNSTLAEKAGFKRVLPASEYYKYVTWLSHINPTSFIFMFQFELHEPLGLVVSVNYGITTTFPQCSFHWNFQKYSVKILYAIIDWVCLGIPKHWLVGYLLTCPIEQCFYFYPHVNFRKVVQPGNSLTVSTRSTHMRLMV